MGAEIYYCGESGEAYAAAESWIAGILQAQREAAGGAAGTGYGEILVSVAVNGGYQYE